MNPIPMMTLLFATLLPGALAMPQGNPLAKKQAPSAPMAGTFSDGNLTLTLNAAERGYQGTLVLGDASYRIAGQARGSSLSGHFYVGEQPFEYEASLRGTTLTFITDGTSYSLLKQTTTAQGQSNASPLGQELRFRGGQLFFTEQVTKKEAQSLGEFLVSQEFFDDSPKAVQLDRQDSITLFRFVVLEGYLNDTSFEDIAAQFATEISRAVFDGQPVHVHLCDGQMKTQKVVKPRPKASSNPLAKGSKSSPYEGSFSDGQITLTLSLQGDSAQGSLRQGGMSFPVRARIDQGKIDGSFNADGQTFSFRGGLQGSTLVVESDGSTYRLQKQGGPTASGPSPTPRPIGNELAQSHQSPLGLAFRFPGGWRVEESQDGVMLVPHDQSSNAQGPTELFFIGRESAPGIARADEASVGQYLDGEVASIIPFVKRQGRPEAIDTQGDSCALYRWSGVNPQKRTIEVHVFVRLMKGSAYVLTAVAEKERMQARSKTLRSIFESFEKCQAPLDPRLIGMWRHTDSMISGGFSMVTEIHMRLAADGTFGRSSQSAGGDGGSSISSGGGPGWENTGTWSATDGTLTLNYQDGSVSQCGYYVEGGSLMMKFGKNDRQLWDRL